MGRPYSEEDARVAVMEWLDGLSSYLKNESVPNIAGPYFSAQWNPAKKRYERMRVSGDLSQTVIKGLVSLATVDGLAFDLCVALAKRQSDPDLDRFRSDPLPIRPTKRGRKTEGNYARDLVIRGAIAEAARWLPKSSSGSRNVDSTPSACKLVAECLTEFGVYLSASTIDEIRKGYPTRKRNARKRALHR